MRVAATYTKRIRRALGLIKEYPRSGTRRVELGEHARVAVISPYVLIYDYEASEDVVTVLRIIHGRRDVVAVLTSKKS